ncbi:unnamed protein product, partial [Ectocarpus sp. 12 AP-2014]
PRSSWARRRRRRRRSGLPPTVWSRTRPSPRRSRDLSTLSSGKTRSTESPTRAGTATMTMMSTRATTTMHPWHDRCLSAPTRAPISASTSCWTSWLPPASSRTATRQQRRRRRRRGGSRGRLAPLSRRRQRYLRIRTRGHRSRRCWAKRTKAAAAQRKGGAGVMTSATRSKIKARLRRRPSRCEEV